MVRTCWDHENSQPVESPRMDVIKDKINSSIQIADRSPADLIQIKNSKYIGPYQALKGIFLEYFNESSIHGFKYIGDQKRPTLDRLIWLCAFILSFSTCCYLVTNISNKRNSTPVIVTFNEKPISVWDIPFPTVTICPETKTHTDIFNFTDVYWKIDENKTITELEQYYWEAIYQVCQAPVYSDQNQGNYFANASDLIEALLNTSLNLNDTLDSCVWKSMNHCFDYFKHELTEEGICFSFNSMKANQYRDELQDVFNYDANKVTDWDLENGYRVKTDQETFPLRAIGTGAREGLHLVLVERKLDQDLLCRRGFQGYKVILHTPGQKPEVSKTNINIPFDRVVSVSITPEIVTASEKLRNYEPERRQCYFQDERYLRYFKLYTQTNCELECLSNRTLETCGCVKFSMPRNASHAVCGAKRIDCLYYVENEIKKLKLENQANDQIDDDILCNCLPTCKSIKYRAELDQNVPFDILKTLNAYKQNDLLNFYLGFVTTEVTISFKEEVFNALKRSELYSTTDLLANCGGLMGLFMGVSLLSLVELVYFFTIRLWAYLKTRYWKNRHTSKLHRRIFGRRKLHHKKALPQVNFWKKKTKKMNLQK